MQKTKWLLVLVALAGSVVGCASPTREGVIVRGDRQLRLRNRKIGPVIPIQRPDGEIVMLHKAAYPFHVVVFIEANKAQRIDPRVMTLARTTSLYGIACVQIAEPTATVKLTEPTTLPPDAPRNLISLRDPEKLGFLAFEDPAPGAVFIMNRDNYIDRIESLDHLDEIRFRLHQLQRKWERDRESLFYGGHTCQK